MNILKILFISPAPENKGTYFRCFNLARYLVQRGNQVSVVCTKARSSRAPYRKMVEGVEVWTCPIRTSNSDAPLAFLVGTILNSLLTLVKKYDVVHVFTLAIPSSALSAIWFKLLKKTRDLPHLVLADWDDWWGRGGILADYGKLPATIGTFLEEKIAAMTDGLTVVSDALRMRAISLGIDKKRIFSISNGADVDSNQILDRVNCQEKLGLSHAGLVFTQIGFTDPRAFHTLILAFRELLLRGVKATLALAGDLGDENLKQLEISQAANIANFGSIPYGTVQALLGASDVLLLSMRHSVVEEARWPIRLGDYLASGRPVIATDVGEVGRIIGKWNCGLAFEPHNELQLADDMWRLSVDSDLRGRMGSKSREAAQYFSWAAIAGHLEEIYETLW